MIEVVIDMGVLVSLQPSSSITRNCHKCCFSDVKVDAVIITLVVVNWQVQHHCYGVLDRINIIGMFKGVEMLSAKRNLSNVDDIGRGTNDGLDTL
jgi:hypothetical protein